MTQRCASCFCADRREIEPPRDLLDRVRARLQENTVRSPSATPARATARWTKRAWFAGAGAAAVVLIALLFSLQPSSIAWSQVAEAVRALPWVHIKAVGGEGRSQETWLSFSRNIFAMRYGGTVRYDDLGSGVRYDYDPRQRKLYRLSVSDHRADELDRAEGLFRTIFRGEAVRPEDFGGGRIVKSRQRTVTEEGRRWIVYELEIGDPNDEDPSHTSSLVIRVDPQKKLPALMTCTRGKEKEQATFDYPDKGPADVYALGVPRDVTAEDRTPPPDLERIIKIVRQNRRDFGDYLAVAGGNTRSTVRLIRCKGDKFRVDVGVGDIRHVASTDQMEQWWQEHGREAFLQAAILSDGRRVDEHSLVRPELGWKPLPAHIKQGDGRAAAEGTGNAGERFAEYFVDLLAYPSNLVDLQNLASWPLYTVHLDPKGENGPAGSIRVELMRADQGGPNDRNAYRKEEFWLHPKYGYAVVKQAWSGCPAVDEDPRRKEKQIIHEYDGFRQTPRGIWYPTVSRYKNASSSKNEDKPGGVEFHDEVTYFYLDFTAELPDALFSTAWQGDLLAGIHFARREGKPVAGDFGKIRPPGGVPLFFGGPGHEISVQAVERARQRLEAVPKEDLEKWVVELERIIDEKLKDGLPSARQVCRTDFVIHMSLAFDDVKWNAKRADNLFQRARTLPASEAKIWKEAFESLMKKKIGQTDTSICDGGPEWAVPLVLIPVDALYEGQEYSVERAKKYLARLKQLTADDVALWLDKVDAWGGTRLDAATNIILLDDYFDNEQFQRDKFKAAIEARKK